MHAASEKYGVETEDANDAFSAAAVSEEPAWDYSGLEREEALLRAKNRSGISSGDASGAVTRVASR
jgi:hypothetical protein